VLPLLLAGLLLAVAAGCGGADGKTEATWTRAQAEAVDTVRGMRVHVRECRGLGGKRIDDGVVRYARFACVAGARRRGERYDTVGIFYTLRPLAAFDRGGHARYALTNVRFIGGPGVP
jgi:hypothetical protein